MIFGESYHSEVLSRNRSRLHASLLWIREQRGIDQSDLDAFDLVRKHRNELVHEPLAFVASHEHDLDPSKFKLLVDRFVKVEKWWVVYFELAINPEILPDGTNLDDVIPGPVWSLQLLFDIALGDEPEEGFYYNAFMQNKA